MQKWGNKLNQFQPGVATSASFVCYNKSTPVMYFHHKSMVNPQHNRHVVACRFRGRSHSIFGYVHGICLYTVKKGNVMEAKTPREPTLTVDFSLATLKGVKLVKSRNGN